MTNIIELPPGYVPSENEAYMNERQLEYFRRKLLAWKRDLEKESQTTVEHLKDEDWSGPDVTDRAALEMQTSLELKTRDRYRKLMNKIDEALERIRKRTYGYCEETSEPIGVKRLEARPITTLSIEAQERHERIEKSHKEDYGGEIPY